MTNEVLDGVLTTGPLLSLIAQMEESPPEPAADEVCTGRLVVISGPSGAGKTTVLRQLFACCPRLVHSVSATTRPPRPNEVDGIDYHFLTPEQFANRRAAGDFIECFEVFGSGFWYGTLREEVAPRLAAGKWVVLEIDVDGAQAVVGQYPEAITVFVRPQSLEELERRLRGRGTESEAAISRRLEVARRELSFAGRYQFQVTNDSVGRTVQEICDIFDSL